jgi:pyridoxamine 5'-phosphate oxidase
MTDAPDPPLVAGEAWLLLTDWLPANDVPERPTMTLSTVTSQGAPDARTLLLSSFDVRGFSFHTDARSRKVGQLAANPAVALTFLWPGFVRQLVVQGTAQPAPPDEVAAAYRARSPYLQQLAWLNTAEFALLPDAERLARWQGWATDRPATDHPHGVTQPPTWVGYLVRPSRLTFWLGDPLTASRRSEFTATGDGWVLSHLPG